MKWCCGDTRIRSRTLPLVCARRLRRSGRLDPTAFVLLTPHGSKLPDPPCNLSRSDRTAGARPLHRAKHAVVWALSCKAAANALPAESTRGALGPIHQHPAPIEGVAQLADTRNVPHSKDPGQPRSPGTLPELRLPSMRHPCASLHIKAGQQQWVCLCIMQPACASSVPMSSGTRGTGRG